MSSGLRFRLQRAARQIAQQHQHLNELLREIDHALAAGDRARLGKIFAAYRGLVDAHFSLEDEVFFPALHGLHPEHGSELEALSSEHVGFGAQLSRLEADLAADLVDSFERGLRGLVDELNRHETREEKLVRQLSDLGEGARSTSKPES